MITTILIAPSGPTLLKSLAAHGVSTMNLRIMNPGELARFALMQSGVPIPETFLNANDEVPIIAEAVMGESYFKSASYSDMKDIAAAIRKARLLISKEEAKTMEACLSKGCFPEKNRALLSVYEKYMKTLDAQNAVDAVALIRKAIEKCAPLNAEILTLKEYPLKPLENELVSVLSEGKAKETTLRELYRVAEQPLTIDSIKNCYGAPNEVETIISDVYSNHKLDECIVAVTDSGTYGQLFFDYSVLYDLPVTFGTGIPIINSNPAKLLVLYHRWIAGGFFGKDALMAMLSDETFLRSALFDQFPNKDQLRWDDYYQVLGNLRLTNDSFVNRARIDAYKRNGEKKELLPALEVTANELALSVEEFIYKYAFIRRKGNSIISSLLSRLDLAAVNAIYDELKTIRSTGFSNSLDDIIAAVFRKNVLTEGSVPGKLHVTSVEKAAYSLRSNLYVAGLSASKYPGSPREDHLLLDRDICAFGPEAKAFTSEGRVNRKKDVMESLVHLAASMGSKIRISYAGLNVSELKKDNESSLIYELFQETKGGAATTKDLEDFTVKVGYFEPAISASRSVGEAFNRGDHILTSETQLYDLPSPISWRMDKEYSPSTLTTFFGCPRRFMLTKIIGIQEPEEDDPFEVISAAESGTLAHSMMEYLGADSTVSKDKFLSHCAKCFDEFIEVNPVLIQRNAEAEKEQFLEMMETAFDSDPRNEILLEEEDMHAVHECGIKVHGRIDRVERLEDGSSLIVDFKSGRNLSHKPDDIDSCFQGALYAYIMEKNGHRVSGAEFRYLRRGESVSCKYDDEIKLALANKLAYFKECMENGTFPATPGEDNCKYCKLAAICTKETVSAEEEEEWRR